MKQIKKNEVADSALLTMLPALWVNHSYAQLQSTASQGSATLTVSTKLYIKTKGAETCSCGALIGVKPLQKL